MSYLEGCTAPAFDENTLHAAVVELSAAKNAEIKYSTVQNWCGCLYYKMVSVEACVVLLWLSPASLHQQSSALRTAA